MKMRKDFEHYSWQDFGEYFGYPKCCIIEFHKLEHVGGPSRKLCGTGYIPCKKCNEKSEAELVAAISETRKCSKPFPFEDIYG